MSIHFLHIRKTGGSAVRTALQSIASARDIIIWGHDQAIAGIPDGDKIIFCIRDPVSRFVSGFNSRLRRGRPLNNVDWRPEERRAFEEFPKPNDLAEALSSADSIRREAARTAMGSIYHVRHRLSEWVGSIEYLDRRSADILMVLSQPDLDADFERLKQILDLPAEIQLPADDVLAHRSPLSFDTSLSGLGRKNLIEWYDGDFSIYRACMDLRSRLISRA